jgi:hypothetical protein
MTTPDIYERVARTLANSLSVGPYASYDFILKRLREHFPTEAALRDYISECESKIHRFDPSFKFIHDDPLQ